MRVEESPLINEGEPIAMKTRNSVLKPLALLASALFWCAWNLPAQTAPTITTQPTNQTVLGGTNVNIIVAVAGKGPFSYQWLLNGTNLPNNTITTVAGDGSWGYSGDHAAATNASLSYPLGVALDAAGNLYIADYANERIRKVDTNGIITTVAGDGVSGFSGDGAAATNASLYYPVGVALDPAGNLLIADYYNQRIREVGTNGIITTIAGNGTNGYSGDGGAGTNASLYYPFGVVADGSGNVYIADYYNSRIRRVGASGIITTVAGNGTARFAGDSGAATSASISYPMGVAFDLAGNLYIADTDNCRIRKVASNGIITTVAGNGTYSYSGDGGAATSAGLYYPSGVAVDSFGNIYICEEDDARIRRVDTNGIITTLAGNGTNGYSGDGGAATNASLYYPYGVAVDATGNVYIGDEENCRVRKVSITGNPMLSLPGVSSNNAGSYKVVITSPYGSVTSAVAALAVVYAPSILVQPFHQTVLGGSNATLSVTAAGTPPLSFAWYENATNLIQSGTNTALALVDVSATNAGSYTVVVTGTYGIVTSVVATVTVLPLVFTSQPASQTVTPGSSATLTVGARGDGPFWYLWYLDNTNLVQSSSISTLTVHDFSTSSAGNYTVVVTNVYGSVTSRVATLYLPLPPTVTAQPGSQTALAGSNVTFNVAVGGPGPFTYQWQFNGANMPNNLISTVAGNGAGAYAGDGGAATNASLNYPAGAALDAADNLYIADTDNNRIRKVDTKGAITTVAGNGSGVFAGDGGAATNASLNNPYGVTMDAAGNLYIADTYNQRIRKVDINGNITTVAGNGASGYSGDGGTATSASLSYPTGVALDAAGNLYIADNNNNRIREVGLNGIIRTVAGNGSAIYAGDGGGATSASLANPSGVALDAFGDLYIADSLNERIREVDTNGIITTVAGNGSADYTGDGGAATNASLYFPDGVALDAAGNLFIADYDNERIRKVDANGVITTVAGGGGGGLGDGGAPSNAILQGPFGVALDAFGNLYIADSYNNRMRQVTPVGNATLWLPGVVSNNTGSYTVVIANPYGSVTSAVAALTVVYPASILVQPATHGVFAGSNGTLSVTAAGTPALCYSWYFNATNLLQSGAIPTLTVQNFSTSNVGAYTVVVTNLYGSVTSQVVTLDFPPSVTTQPGGSAVLVGGAATFSVAVAGSGPLSYQWQFNGTNFPNNIITTVAGITSGGFSGDSGPATSARLYLPEGVAVDVAGNLYIADAYNQRIRKVKTNGVISTVAGKGTAGFAGDHAAATAASLYYPQGVAVDAAGNLYIADTDNSRIRKVDTKGVITTVAGKSSMGYSGDGGAATNATLYYPMGVALDAAGNLYIADKYNNRVRKVNTRGIITTVAGNGNYGHYGDGGAATNASLDYPYSVAVDAAGNLYIADYYDQRIRKVATNGIITTVAGNGSATYAGDGGAATNASLNGPYGVTADAAGDLYIADYSNSRVRKVDTAGLMTTLAGNGTNGYFGDHGLAASASLDFPEAVAVDGAGNLYIADTDNNRVRKVLLYAAYPSFQITNVDASNGGSYTVVVTSPYGSLTSAVAALTVVYPPSILVQPASQFAAAGSSPVFSITASGTGPLEYLWYFAGANLFQSGTNSTLALPGVAMNNAGNYTVVITNAYGSVTSQVAALAVGFPPSVTTQPGSKSVLPGSLARFSVAVGGTGPFSYQWQFDGANFPNNIITTVAGNGNGAFAGDGGQATNASLYFPEGVVADAGGSLYVADAGNNRIRKVAANGIITTMAGNGVGAYAGDGGPATNASMYYPYGVTVDAAGNVYIADTYNSSIRKVATNGIITTVAGNGNGGYSGDGAAATNASLYYPYGLAVDAVGNLYIADTYNNSIREVDTNGVITTVAGDGNAGYSGDGGAATNASLNGPEGVALDAAGNLFIADSGNNSIRKVGANGIITTMAGNGAYGYSAYDAVATNASLAGPAGLALYASGGLFIADYNNQVIREVDTNGFIGTVAGNGNATYAGDGGPATSAGLNSPSGMCLDAAGNLYIADSGNNCIRKVLFQAAYGALTLNSVGSANGGNYTVVITSPYGSVTSVVAVLDIGMAKPQIIAGDASFGFLTNRFGFNLSGTAGQTIIVEGSSDLVNWTPLCTNTVGGGPCYFCDPACTNFGRRFYRARLP